jgi:hypothetical protein
MISKTTRPYIAVLAASLCSLRGRRLQALRGLHSRPHQGRALPEAEQVRSQRCLPIGF